jgi:hypothetical protein
VSQLSLIIFNLAKGQVRFLFLKPREHVDQCVAGCTNIREVGTASMQNLYKKTRMITNYHLPAGTNAVWLVFFLQYEYVIES